MAVKYVIKTGETLTLDLNVLEGSIGLVPEVASIEASLKKAQGSNMIPASNTPKAATFTVLETFKGWAFTLTSTQTATINPGLYMMDAKITMDNGEVIITDPIQIEVRGSVT